MRRPPRLLTHLTLALLCLPFGTTTPVLAQRASAPAPVARQPQQQLRVRGSSRAAAAPARRQEDRQVAGVAQPAAAAVTVNVSELTPLSDLSPQKPRIIPEPQGEEEIPHNRPLPEGAVVFSDETGLAQSSTSVGEPRAPSPATTASFQGSPATGSIPPDTQGTVGPNHLVVAVNGGLRVQNKTGGTVASVSLSSFFAPIMGGSTDVFDPRLQYDQFGGRWILIAVADRQSAASAVVVAVSQTGDPSSTWNLYRLDADGANASWADYPILGFNKDWIVVSVNMFANPGSSASFYSRFFVMNKANAYAGVALSSTTISAPNSISGTMAPTTTLDGALATMYVLQAWNGNSGGNGYLRLYTITGAVNSPVLNNTGTGLFISAPAPWDFSPPNGSDFAPQLGSSIKIQLNDHGIGNVVYRGGSLWAAHTVFLPAGGNPTRSAIQWWEINPTNQSVIQRGRVDGAASGHFYAFPTIAVNQNRDVLVGYAKFSASQYGGSGYSFRAGADAASTLRDDATLKTGEGVYNNSFGGRNRWGDYSGTAVDPANDTDMWTLQEYATASNNWSTWWGRVSGGGSPACTTTPIAVGQTLSGTLSASSCRYPLGSSWYSDQYTFSGTSGQEVAILMTSTSFNTWLALVGPAGAELTSDDDGGGGTNSRIPATSGSFTLPSTGTYTIQASAFSTSTGGAYSLSLTAPGTSCTYGISPSSNTFGAGGGTGGVTVTTQAGCAWTANSNASWISVTAGSSGTGGGAVSYSVASTTIARTGTISIAGLTFTVNQNATEAGAGLKFYPLPAPVRLLDTRPGEPACFTPASPISAGVVYTQVAVGTCTGIPSTAQAVAGNLAVVNTLSGSGSGFVTLFPSNAARPLASNINYVPDQIINNFFTIGLGTDGALKIYTHTTLHLLIDVTGYYAP